MKKILKLFVASLLTATLSVATVICCCVAPAVMAHFHQVTICCSHCADKCSHDNSSNPGGACQNKLTSAEFSGGQTISTPKVSLLPFLAPVFLNNHYKVLSSTLSLAYPPGGPPLGISFTPLYLRTFNLRV